VVEHVVLFSGGIGSWAAARRLVERGITPTLLFTDTNMEDEDLYRFLDEAAADVGGNLVRVADGRTPWEVFHDVRFIANSRIDPCSRILKRELARAWVEENGNPETTTVYLGIDWTEEHRLQRARGYWSPFRVEGPMCEPPLMVKPEMIEWAASRGLTPPRLYEMGFPHNNCGGFCVKAGFATFALLLRTMPDRYEYHEQQEERMREYLGADVSILKDRRGGGVTPMTLKEFKRRLCVGNVKGLDMGDWGGCGCMIGDDYDDQGKQLALGLEEER